jgi:ABC-2 type transport system ATP-binding protein
MEYVAKLVESAIISSSLTKVYSVGRGKEQRKAVDSLSLNIERGETFAFLGPNGAGKTTTIKMLLGFIRPTSGSAEIFGTPIDNEAARAKVGYVPEQPYFPKFLTSIELIKEHGVLSGLDYKQAKRKAIDCLDTVGMLHTANTRISKLSKGMTQRIGLACALVGDPELLIMDEPSSGLDPVGRKELGELLQRFKAQGKTVFVSSHLLTEIEPLCDRVGILARGSLVACGTPDEIVAVRDKVAVAFAGDQHDNVLSEQMQKLGAEEIDTSVCHQTPDGYEHKALVPASLVFNFIELLKNRNAILRSVGSRRETLEDAFLRLVNGGLS